MKKIRLKMKNIIVGFFLLFCLEQAWGECLKRHGDFNFEGIYFSYNDSSLDASAAIEGLVDISVDKIEPSLIKGSIEYISSSTEKDSVFFKITRKEVGKSCRETFIAFSPVSVCTNERWRVERTSNNFNVFGENVSLENDPDISVSTICGSTIVRGGKISSSTILSRVLEGDHSLEINSSTILSSKLIQFEDEPEEKSKIINSFIYASKFNGNIDFVDASILNSDFNLFGNIRCRGDQCSYTSDPCEKLGDNFRVHSTDITLYSQNGFSPWNDTFFTFTHPKKEFECKNIQKKRVRYFSKSYPLLGDFTSLPLIESNWKDPLIEKIGCVFDGRISKPALRLHVNKPSSPVSDDGGAASLIMFCNQEDVNEEGHIADRVITSNIVPNMEMNYPLYFLPISYPTCYSFTPYLKDKSSVRQLTDLKIDYEDCSDCSAGMMKVNGICGCPEGTVENNGSCVNQVNVCELGLCGCFNSTKPYRLPGLNNFVGVCEPTLYDFEDNSPFEESTLTASLTVEPCISSTGKIKIHINNSSYYNVQLRFYCKNRVTPSLFKVGVGELGEEVRYIDRFHTKDFEFKYNNNLNCYDYIAQVTGSFFGDPPKTLWKQNVSFPYPHCSI